MADTNEDEWVVPEQWRAQAEAFRGIHEPTPQLLNPEATAALIAVLSRYHDSVRTSLEVARDNGLREIADAAQEYLAAPETCASPIGAAAICALVNANPWRAFPERNGRDAEYVQREIADLFVDSWIQQHGLAFAAEIVVRRREFTVDTFRRTPAGITYDALGRVSPTDPGSTIPVDLEAHRVRAALAIASESEYQAAVRRLSELRAQPGTVWARVATSYLVPDRQDWLDADLTLDLRDGQHYMPRAVLMLTTSATTGPQLNRVLESAGSPLLFSSQQIHTMLTRIGAAAVPTIVREFTGFHSTWTEDIKRFAGMLAQVPADEAFQALLDRSDNKHVAAALAKAATRYPRRAMRLLSRHATESATPLVVQTLRLHAVAHPDLIADYADPAAKALLESARRFPDADTAQLPAVLAAPAPKKPKLPSWLALSLLPQIRLRDSQSALPESAVTHLITLLSSGPDRFHPDVAAVAEIADPTYLAEFSWALFDGWHLAAYPAKDRWALRTLALFGTDDTVRRLVPFIQEWPSKSGTARAIEGLNVLATIGSDTALEQLHRLAERTRQAKMRTHAQEKVAQIAERLGLADDELADRLVPRLGLSVGGTLTLDYGPRQFVIGLDNQLRTTITTDGKPLRTLPKPAATDDPDLAPLAHESFRAFTKELKTVTTEQIRRFEGAMVDGRRWRAELHRKTIVEHPVLGQLARRLVWATFDATGAVTGSFRVDTDGSYADADDEPFELPDDALVGVAHPLHLADSLDRWRGVFTDYELLQPFDQLDRDIHAFTAEEASSNHLSRFENRKVSTGKVYGLRNRGWELAYNHVIRHFDVTHHVTITLDVGIRGGYYGDPDEQQIVSVRIGGGTFGALDAVAASELLRQLERLAV